MMWLLLLGLTTVVVLLPMVPAWIEWRWPSDVTPLFIGEDDALDPPFLARSFASRLATALALRQTHLGRSSITSLPAGKAWPFEGREAATASTHRVWDLLGDTELPAGMRFLGEVAARGSLRTAPGGVHRALWVRDHLHLAAGATVLRWAHAHHIDVGPDADLAGRLSADSGITLAPGTRFVLLHAPVLRFAPARQVPSPGPAADPVAASGAPAAVAWQQASGRGHCPHALAVPAGSRWRGDLVCGDDLRLGAGCQVQGSLKAHGTLTLGAGCVVHGSLVSTGPIHLQRGCSVRGSIVSEAAIVLGEGCVVGGPGQACTVSAPRIDVGAAVVVHGTVWSSEAGLCHAQGPAGAATPAPTAPRRAAEAGHEATA